MIPYRSMRRTQAALRRLLSLPIALSHRYVRTLDKLRPGYGTSLAEQQHQLLSIAGVAAGSKAAGLAIGTGDTDGTDMKVLFAGREAIYGILRSSFETLGVQPRIAELGVLDGTNAARLRELIAPSAMFLVDAWSKDAFVDYRKANAHRSWVDDLDRYAEYFGGSLDDQATFDRLHDAVVARFSGLGDVKIIRSSTAGARDPLLRSLNGDRLDLVYVDASHQYETVLDDLLMYGELVSADGALQLNDCCHSAAGVRQNLGVLEAAVKFCKMSDFVPALLTNTDWTDLLLVRRQSNLRRAIDEIVARSDLAFVEIPNQLLGAATVRYGKRANLSFC